MVMVLSYLALYRRLRPQTFDDVVEQQHVVRTLRNSIIQNRIAHAYLFCGTRGTGKTTMAQIFARAVNCLSPENGNPCNKCEICRGILSGTILDVLEIDAASNNSVDNIREIRDEVVYSPSQARYKVYIIDEVHMLSSGAFNALLKTLEEPPSHVIFILATTEPHRLPATILSRCQRFDFRRITAKGIIGSLEQAAAESGVNIDQRALKLIASLADGALRDAFSILDQCMTLGNEISYNDVLSVVGIVNRDFIDEFARVLYERNIPAVLEMVDQLLMDGKDILTFANDLTKYFRDLLIVKLTGNPENILDMPEDRIDSMKSLAGKIDKDELIAIIRQLSAISSDLKSSTQPRIIFETELIRICTNTPGKTAQLEDRLTLLEKRLSEFEKGNVQNLFIQQSQTIQGKFPGQQNIKSNPQSPQEHQEPEQQKTENPGTSETQLFSPPAEAETSKPNTRPDDDDGKKPLPVWDKLMKLLRNSGKPMLYNILINAKAYMTGENQAAIVFETGIEFHKKMASSPENIKYLQAAISQLMGKEISIKCYMENEFFPQFTKASGPEDDTESKARLIAQKFEVPFTVIED